VHSWVLVTAWGKVRRLRVSYLALLGDVGAGLTTVKGPEVSAGVVDEAERVSA